MCVLRVITSLRVTKLVWVKVKERSSTGQLGSSYLIMVCGFPHISFIAFQLDVSYLRLEAFPYVKNLPETVRPFVPNFYPFNIHNSSTSSSGEASNNDGIHHSLYSTPLRQFGSSSTKTCPRGSRRFYCCTPSTNRIICIPYTKHCLIWYEDIIKLGYHIDLGITFMGDRLQLSNLRYFQPALSVDKWN